MDALSACPRLEAEWNDAEGDVTLKHSSPEVHIQFCGSGRTLSGVVVTCSRQHDPHSSHRSIKAYASFEAVDFVVCPRRA